MLDKASIPGYTDIKIGNKETEVAKRKPKSKPKLKTNIPASAEEYYVVWRFTCAEELIHGFWGVRLTPIT